MEDHFNFLIDEELVLTKDSDLLGTKVYSDSLEEIILKNVDLTNSLNIGLFGPWGSGKSSIVHSLKNKFINSDSVSIFIYNSWKYSEDAFRRSFLLELIKYYNLSNKFQSILDEFYNTTTVDKKIENTFDWKKILWNLPFLLPIIIYILLFGFLTSDIRAIATLLTASISILSFLFVNFIKAFKTTTAYSKVFSPEQFSIYFQKIVSEILKDEDSPKQNFLKIVYKKVVQVLFPKPEKNKIKKLIIVIDNIDRCDGETAQEILLTIKNFLDEKSCIFIIPMDDIAIKKLIKKEIQDPEEYLRKFFNVSIRIKQYNELDLFNFTQKIIRKNGLNFNSDIADIISHYFSNNPRRIIQFINNLRVEILVCQKQKLGEQISLDASGNLEFLAKVQLLKEECPELYRRISKNPLVLPILENKISQKDYSNRDYVKGTYDFTIGEIEKFELTESEVNFLNMTSIFKPNNFETFFLLNDTYDYIDPKFGETISAGDSEKLKKLIEEDKYDFNEILKYLKNKLNQNIGKNDRFLTNGLPLFKILFSFYNYKNYEEFQTKILNLIIPYNTNSNFKKIISGLNYIEFVSVSYVLFRKMHYGLSNSLSNFILENFETNEELFKNVLIYYKNELDYLHKFQQNFSELLINAYQKFDVYKNFLDSKESITNLINDACIINCITLIQNEPFKEPTNIRLNFLKSLNLKNSLKSENINEYVVKILSFLYSENDFKKIAYWTEQLENFIIKANGFESNEKLKNTLLHKYENGPLKNIYDNKENLLNQDYVNLVKFFIIIMKEAYLQQKNKYFFAPIEFYLRNDNEVILQTSLSALYEIEKTHAGVTYGVIPRVLRLVSQSNNSTLQLFFDILKEYFKVSELLVEKKILNEFEVKSILLKYLGLLNNSEGSDLIKLENWILEVCENQYVRTILVITIGDINSGLYSDYGFKNSKMQNLLSKI